MNLCALIEMVFFFVTMIFLVFINCKWFIFKLIIADIIAFCGTVFFWWLLYYEPDEDNYDVTD